MAASKKSIGWGAVGYTPAGGSATSVTQVTNVKIDRKSKDMPFYGDAGMFPTLIVNRGKTRTMTITSGDVAALAAIDETLTHAVTATFLDAKNGTAIGAVVYTLSNAVVVDLPTNGKVNEYGEASITFMGFAADGTTDPLTIVPTTA